MPSQSDEPTPEEIARVDAHRKAERDRQAAERKRVEEARDAAIRSKLAEQLEGRTIAEVAGDLNYYAEWRSLRLTLSDGTVLVIEPDPYADGPELTIEIERP